MSVFLKYRIKSVELDNLLQDIFVWLILLKDKGLNKKGECYDIMGRGINFFQRALVIGSCTKVDHTQGCNCEIYTDKWGYLLDID